MFTSTLGGDQPGSSSAGQHTTEMSNGGEAYRVKLGRNSHKLLRLTIELVWMRMAHTKLMSESNAHGRYRHPPMAHPVAGVQVGSVGVSLRKAVKQTGAPDITELSQEQLDNLSSGLNSAVGALEESAGYDPASEEQQQRQQADRRRGAPTQSSKQVQLLYHLMPGSCFHFL